MTKSDAPTTSLISASDPGWPKVPHPHAARRLIFLAHGNGHAADGLCLVLFEKVAAPPLTLEMLTCGPHWLGGSEDDESLLVLTTRPRVIRLCDRMDGVSDSDRASSLALLHREPAPDHLSVMLLAPAKDAPGTIATFRLWNAPIIHMDPPQQAPSWAPTPQWVAELVAPTPAINVFLAKGKA